MRSTANVNTHFDVIEFPQSMGALKAPEGHNSRGGTGEALADKEVHARLLGQQDADHGNGQLSILHMHATEMRCLKKTMCNSQRKHSKSLHVIMQRMHTLFHHYVVLPFFLALTMLNSLYVYASTTFSSPNTHLSILELGLPSVDSHCFLRRTEDTSRLANTTRVLHCSMRRCVTMTTA